MKVKEAIEILKKANQDLELVWHEVVDENDPHAKFEYSEIFVIGKAKGYYDRNVILISPLTKGEFDERFEILS